MAKVNKRGGFSDRNAIKPINKEIQLIEFDNRTRTQLLNTVSDLYSQIYKYKYSNSVYTAFQRFIKFILGTVYSEPIEYGRLYDDDILELINNTILNDDYDDVLTLIEALAQHWNEYIKKEGGLALYNSYTNSYGKGSVFQIFNKCFEREYVGYRFVGTIIMPISDKYEIDAIEETLSSRYQPVYDHISKANRFLADRDAPDYENSIKESISAVEACCEVLTGVKGKEATLANMLKKLEKNGVSIHGGLKAAFNILYGYTSDANGIRHAGDIGGPASTFEEAKFMLVSCCAFINYLVASNADNE